MIIIEVLLSFFSNIGNFISNSGIRMPLPGKVTDKFSNFIRPRPWRDKYIKEHLSDSAFEIEVKRCKRKEVYVQPRLTDTSPYISDNSIQNQHLWKQNLNAYFIDKIFKESNDDDKVFCILADTGMGKTTALVNLFYSYVNKYNKTNLPFEIRLLSFTDENIFDKINALDNKSNTILLLDAVDESSEAQDDDKYSEFLKKLEQTYRDFAFVITTCRPQFFGEGKDEFDNTNVRRNSYFVRCKKLYLDYFDNTQVSEYLDKMSRKRINHSKRAKAEHIINSCPDIAMRPLVLNYIEYLVADDKEYNTTREIYDVIVKRLIARDIRKNFPRNVDKREKQWLELSSEVAGHMYREHAFRTTVTEAEIAEIVEKFNKNIPDADKVVAQTFRERSLLTRYGTEYRFSHKSFYEFLMAYRFFLNNSEIKSMQGLDFTVHIFNQIVDAWHIGRGNELMPIQQVKRKDAITSLCTIGFSLRKDNHIVAAIKEYDIAEGICRKLIQDGFNFNRELSRILTTKGTHLYIIKEYDEAEISFMGSLEICRNNPNYEDELSSVLNGLGNLHRDNKKFEQAEKEYLEALQIRRNLTQNGSTGDSTLASTLNNIGNLYNETKKYSEAKKCLTEALEIRRRIDRTNPDSKTKQRLSATLNNLGNLHRDFGEYSQASDYYFEALKIRTDLANDKKYKHQKMESFVAMTLHDMAKLYKDQGVYDNAIIYAKNSLKKYQESAKNSPELFNAKVTELESFIKQTEKLIKENHYGNEE